jgi:putative membrane protein
MTSDLPAAIAYCGLPPVPQDLWMRWNFDPPLVLVLFLVAAAYGWGVRRSPAAARPTGKQQAAFSAGWAVTVLCFVSPLCALSVALFSARVAQHMLLMLVAAPLLAYGRSGSMLRPLEPLAGRLSGRLWSGSGLPVTGVAFAVLLWFWHAPQPYDASLRNDFLYWTMHVSLLGAAVLFWAAQIGALEGGRGIGVAAAGLATTIQMSLLGALLTFASSPLFLSHLGTAFPWGLTPIEDQQLGGLVMWVPGGLVFTASSLAGLMALLMPREDVSARGQASGIP